jgi:L-alanine-DL-glutamate epimerase-like enolase superfamily enzyme
VLYKVRTGCHGATDLSPITMAAHLQLGLVVPNPGIQEYMLLRAHKEWDCLPRSVTGGPWDYATHPEALDQFWRAGLMRNKNY